MKRMKELIEEIESKKKCPECDSGMVIYQYTLTVYQRNTTAFFVGVYKCSQCDSRFWIESSEKVNEHPE